MARWLAALIGLAATGAAAAPVGIQYVALKGRTLAADPTLAGTAVVDEVTPFSTTNAEGQVLAGSVQHRVSRRADGRLDFSWRIRFAPGSVAPFQVLIQDFKQPGTPIEADWRIDGLGGPGPARARWNPNGGELTWIFDTGCSGLTMCPSDPKGTRFFYARSTASVRVKTARLYVIANPTLSVMLPTFAPSFLTPKAIRPSAR